jgi:FMN phosphatase YigB (HAD superfamily)
LVGVNFESDILGANNVGISGVWFNWKDAENKKGEHYWTVHRLSELLLYF